VKANVLVLGASGLVGRRLTALLAQSDWAAPIAASRRPGAGTMGAPARQLDATDARGMAAALDGVTAVVNCIAGDPRDIAAGARVLADSARARGGDLHVVHLSSLAVYGSATGTVDESAPLRADHSAYGSAKVAAERSIAALAQSTILRPGIIYGPGSPWWTERIGRLLRTRRLGDLGPAGMGFCNLVHVDDVAAATVAVLRRGPVDADVFNLSTPRPVTWNEYFSAFAAALGAAPVRRVSPARLAVECRLIGPPLRALELLSNRFPSLDVPVPPAIRPWLLALCRQDLYTSVERIRTRLGFKFMGLEEGLRDTATAMKATAGRESCR